MDDVVHVEENVEENVELETKKEVDEGNTSRNAKICLRSTTALPTKCFGASSQTYPQPERSAHHLELSSSTFSSTSTTSSTPT